MNIFDVQGFRTPEVKAVESKPAESEQRFQSNDFDKTVTGVNPLVQMEVINSRYNMGWVTRLTEGICIVRSILITLQGNLLQDTMNQMINYGAFPNISNIARTMCLKFLWAKM